MPLAEKEKYNNYMRDYMKRRYHERRAEAIQLLGSRCVRCNATENLETDHIDRTTKSFDLGKLWSIARHLYLEELEKCQLLCEDCHKKKSALEMSVSHGGGVSGKKNCKCEPCRIKKRDYMRNYRQGSVS